MIRSHWRRRATGDNNDRQQQEPQDEPLETMMILNRSHHWCTGDNEPHQEPLLETRTMW